MALGPFVTYVPPGVYSRTLSETNAANLVAGLRIPVLVGVGQEDLDQTDFELVRGSSATLDQQIVAEDVSQRLVLDDTNPSNPILGAANGTAAKFRVRNYPIVDGQGFGQTANKPSSVSVTVNGDPVAVGSVAGATGYVTLQVPPQVGDDIRITYYFHRGDTSFTDDVSDQITAGTAALTTPAYGPFTIVASTTDTLVLTVDGTENTIVLAAGSYSASALDALISAQSITGLAVSVFTDNQGKEHLKFEAAQSLVVGSGNANGALGFTSGTSTSRNTLFRVFQRPVVDGTGGGVTTTDPSKVTVLVNGSQVVATAVDGTNGVVTLPSAPAAGSTVTIQYWANTWQDTFDYLPNTSVSNVTRCGFAPGRSDYIENTDFVISNPSLDVSMVHWGASYQVASTFRTAGATSFDDTQILPTLVDDRMYLGEATRVVDTTVVPALLSPNSFTLPEVPTTGNGRDTPLGSTLYNSVSNDRIGLSTDRPDLVVVYTGRTLQDALGRNPATVLSVDADTRVVTLKDEVPPDYNAYCTFWYSRLADDTYILTNKVAGGFGTGQYEVYSVLQQENLYQVRFGTKTVAPTIQWPRGVENVPDAFHTGGGTAVAETVTVTFSTAAATNAAYTNEGAAPYDFYATYSASWVTLLDGSTYTTNLASAASAYMVGAHVAAPSDYVTITTGVNDSFKITIDGTDFDVTLVDGNRTPAQICSDINLAATSITGAVSATGTLTFTGNALNGEIVTIGTKVYTFETVLTDVDGHVLIGGTASDSLDNLIAAITLGAGAGTTYATSTTEHTLVTAVAGVGDTMDVTAKVAGTAGNSIASTTNVTGASWATGTLLGGVDGTPIAQYVQIGGSTGDVIFILNSLVSPSALPDGFDQESSVAIRQGTAESTLGFTALETVYGSPTALNKPATILGTSTGPFAITAGVNDELNFQVDGIDYSVTLTTNLPTPTTADVKTDIDAVVASVASVGTGDNLNKLRLTSPTIDPSSSVVILTGTANTALGLTTGDSASMTQVSAQDVVNALLSTSSFTTEGIAYPTTIQSADYVTIESLTTGTGSSVAFGAAGTAFNTTAGTEIVAGTSGDVGEAAHDMFTVTSTDLTNGSAGTGTPGQTYTDAKTGLRFTVLPSASSTYGAGNFTLLVTNRWHVNPAVPSLQLGGLELIVTDTVGVGVDDTATVQAFNPGGQEPAVGDYYYATYQYTKQDFSTRLYQQLKTIEANFGSISSENRVSLAAYLAIQNGAVLVGIKQVLKAPNTNQATAQSFITAIQELGTPLPGNVRPDVICPLSTDTTVYTYLLQHCEVMSNIRNQSERMGFIGFASGTSPTSAQAVARGLLSNRIVAVYPDSAVVTLTNELGEAFEVLVDGTFLASALVGAVVSPAVDVATPYTRRRVNGFTRLVRVLDPVEANQTAVAGITVLEDLDPIIRVRQGLTTDMSTVMTRLPTVTQISDFVQQQSRVVLDAFVGTKFLATRVNEVEVSLSNLFKSLVQAEIVGAYTGINADVDDTDPTIMRVESFYAPIFPLLYLVLTFNLRAQV